MYSHPELVDYFKSLGEALKDINNPQLVYTWIFIVFIGNGRTKDIGDFKLKLDEGVIPSSKKHTDKIEELIRLQVEEKVCEFII